MKHPYARTAVRALCLPPVVCSVVVLLLTTTAICREPAVAAKYRIAVVDGKHRVIGPDGDTNYLSGVAPVGRRDHMRMLKYMGVDLCHIWAHDPVPIELVRSAHANGVKVALFVPFLKGFKATYHNGAHSGDGYPFGNKQVAAVPNFYDPEWQRLFATRLKEMKESLAEAMESVAILWLTNEPEVYYEKRQWLGPDFCIADPHAQAAFRRLMEKLHTGIGALNRAWSDTENQYAFTDWSDFERRALDELFKDWDTPPLTAGAERDLHERFIPSWLNDWQRISERIIREEAGIASPLLATRYCMGSVAGDCDRIPTAGIDAVGMNMYHPAYSKRYHDLTRRIHEAAGLPVISTEWFVQTAWPGDLAYIHGDVVTQTEEALMATDQTASCPWVVADIWQAYGPCPDTLLRNKQDNVAMPHVFHRAHLMRDRESGNSEKRRGQVEPFVLDGHGYRSPWIQVARSRYGNEARNPGIVYKRPAQTNIRAPCDLPLDGPAVFHDEAEEAGALANHGNATALVSFPRDGTYRLGIHISPSQAPGATARLRLRIDGALVSSWDLPPDEAREVTMKRVFRARPYYLTLTWNADSTARFPVAVSRLSVSGCLDPATPKPLLPMKAIPPADPAALHTMFEEEFGGPHLDESRWRPFTFQGESGDVSISTSSTLRLVGRPGSRTGIMTRRSFPTEGPVFVEADASVVSPGRGHNAIVCLVWERELEDRMSIAQMRSKSPYDLRGHIDPTTEYDRLEFGFSPGRGVWTWSSSKGINHPLGMKADTDKAACKLGILKHGGFYRFFIDGEAVTEGMLPDHQGPFRILLYGFGDSTTEWGAVKVRRAE